MKRAYIKPITQNFSLRTSRMLAGSNLGNPNSNQTGDNETDYAKEDNDFGW